MGVVVAVQISPQIQPFVSHVVIAYQFSHRNFESHLLAIEIVVDCWTMWDRWLVRHLVMEENRRHLRLLVGVHGVLDKVAEESRRHSVSDNVSLVLGLLKVKRDIIRDHLLESIGTDRTAIKSRRQV